MVSLNLLQNIEKQQMFKQSIMSKLVSRFEIIIRKWQFCH